MIVPPPTPNNPLNAPAPVAITASFRTRSRATGGDTSAREGAIRRRFPGPPARVRVTAAPAVAGKLARLIAPLRNGPRESAVLFDVDGTLAPIVHDPDDAAVPEATRAALSELARRFGLVACVSGRRAAEARRLVGVMELT